MSLVASLHSSFHFAVTPDGVYINDQRLMRSGPPSGFYSVFGVSDRIVDGSNSPAPVGYRNSQFHYYDRHGITLNEHHYTFQVDAINLVFDTQMAVHPPREPFSGTLLQAGASLTAGSPERALANSLLTFKAQLPGTWFTTVGQSGSTPITIAVATEGPKLRSGRRSRSKIITSVSFCLTNDPWDTTHRPK